MQQEKTFLYHINVTKDCNLRCTHCYIHSDVKSASKSMTDEQIISIAYGIVEHMKKINYMRAEIYFIGGEPTMLGLDFFKRNIPIFNKIVKNAGFIAEVTIATNLLHDDIVEIAKLFDKVMTSYEIQSRFISSKGNYKPKLEQRWLENINKIQDIGIEVYVLVTITKPVINYGARKILDYFYEKNIKKIHFSFFIPQGDGLINIKNMLPRFHETSNFLIDSANWYLEKRDVDLNLWVNPFESMLNAIDNNKTSNDIVCPIITGSLDINWDGNSATCYETGGSTNPDWSGNIFETSIISVTSSKHFIKKVIEASKPQKICRACDEYDVCRSGCGVLFKFFDANLDQDCPGFKKFIKFVRQKYEDGLKPRYAKYIGKNC